MASSMSMEYSRICAFDPNGRSILDTSGPLWGHVWTSAKANAMSALPQIVLKKSFWGDEQKFLRPLMRLASGLLRPLMRLASGDVRDQWFHTKTTTDHRIGATGLCWGRDVKKSTFAEFLVPFDFRLFQHIQELRQQV